MSDTDAETKALERFATEIENAVDDALRRGADPGNLEMILQGASQNMRKRSAERDESDTSDP